jgi:hypothetical protein
MTDREKLDYIVGLLKSLDYVDMFTNDSDTYGIDFTKEYLKIQEQIEDFIRGVIL